MKRKAGAIFGAVLVFCAAAGGYMLYDSQQQKMKDLLDGDAIYNSISVNGIDVSNLEKHEAEELLESELNNRFEDMKISEIADATGLNVSTVKSCLNYGHKKIGEEVEKLEKKGVKLYGISPILF